MKHTLAGIIGTLLTLAILFTGWQLYAMRVTVIRTHQYAFDKFGPPQLTEAHVIKAREFLASDEGKKWAVKFDDAKTTEGEGR